MLCSLTLPTQGANVVPIEHKTSDGNDPTAAEHDLHVENWMDRSFESEYIVEFHIFCHSGAQLLHVPRIVGILTLMGYLAECELN